jgi:hypothetical protein
MRRVPHRRLQTKDYNTDRTRKRKLTATVRIVSYPAIQVYTRGDTRGRSCTHRGRGFVEGGVAGGPARQWLGAEAGVAGRGAEAQSVCSDPKRALLHVLQHPVTKSQEAMVI